MRRGLLGGTFDPIHMAHLIAGEVAFRDLNLDIVTFLPAGAPWQKADRDVSDRTDRWQMTRLAVEPVEYFEADSREVERDGWSYTIDTLAAFPDDELFLVLGADAAAGIPTWKSADQILSRCVVAVVPRPGTDPDAVEDAIGHVHWLDMPLLDLSGTQIRARWSSGRSVRFMVPEAVYRYAVQHRLYE